MELRLGFIACLNSNRLPSCRIQRLGLVLQVPSLSECLTCTMQTHASDSWLSQWTGADTDLVQEVVIHQSWISFLWNQIAEEIWVALRSTQAVYFDTRQVLGLVLNTWYRVALCLLKFWNWGFIFGLTSIFSSNEISIVQDPNQSPEAYRWNVVSLNQETKTGLVLT